MYAIIHLKNIKHGWQTQSVEHGTLDLGVMRSSPTLGVEIIFKN